MKIGNYELRSPWVKMVTMPIEKELYIAIRKSVMEDLLHEIEVAANNVLDNDTAVTEEKSTASVVPEAVRYEGNAYCVKCKENRDFVGVVRTSDSGRQMAQGRCPVCDTKVNRILGKK